MNHIHRYSTPEEAANACGATILASLKEAIALTGRASVAFSGGSTPRIMFEFMAKQEFDWSNVHIFWVDERCVPPDHADSNYRMTEEALLNHIQSGSVHRIFGELPPKDAANRYRQEINLFFEGSPKFNVVHLGMGADAHTASLFPGLREIEDRSGTVANVWVEKLGKDRITLLPKSILDAERIVVLAAGKDKAEPLQKVMTTEYQPLELPIQFVHRGTGSVEWYLDQAAAASLSDSR